MSARPHRVGPAEPTRPGDPSRLATAAPPLVGQAAIAAAGEVKHLWISADDEDRPKQLYARLDFRRVLLPTTEFLPLS